MRPVVLVKLPNSNQFLGTFDTATYTNWWKSQPMPDTVQSIIQNEWCYGQYHLCLTKQANGKWGICRSGDYGMNWTLVAEFTPEVYSMMRIDFGWMLLNAADGWYESTDTGFTWNYISNGAPGCRTVINLENNILLASNGNYIYRSTDTGKNWTTVQNCHNMQVKDFHNNVYVANIVYNGDSYPALAGCNNRVLAGCGPILLISDDAGLTWVGHPSYLYYGWGWNKQKQIVYSPGYAGGEGSSYWSLSNPVRFLQIVHSKSATIPEDNYFIARVYHPRLGVVRNYMSTVGGWGWNATFDQPFSGYYTGNMSSYETMNIGTNQQTIFVFNSQMEYNPTTRGFSPTPKVSSDGGITWTDVNPNLIKVYEGDPDLGGRYVLGGSFVEEDYTNQTWVGYPCHNSGRYVSSGFTRRGISHEVDTYLLYNPKLELPSDLLLAKRLTKTYTLDYTTQDTWDVPADLDTVLKIVPDVPITMSQILMAIKDKSFANNMMLVQRYTSAMLPDLLVQQAMDFQTWHDMLLQGPVQSTYGMNLILVQEHDWSVRFEKYMPQYPYMNFDQLDYDVLDTRKTPVI